MASRLNVRRALLRAVDAFLEGSPDSLARAERIVRRCYAAREFTTLDEIVWGGINMALTDSVYYTDQTYLLQVRTLLAEGSHEIFRAYLNFDFCPQFTPVESVWYARLWELLNWFESFPFEDIERAIAEYERVTDEIKQLAAESPPPAKLGEEMIYHFILREVTEIVVSIEVNKSMQRFGYLLPTGPYLAMPPQKPRVEPDVAESLAWARRALRAIAEEGWLLITWQVTPQHYNLSLL